MRLLDVRAVIPREENIQQAGSKTKVLEELDEKTTEYAILSHRWGKEVDYDEMTGLMKMDEQDRNEVRQRDGYRKIIKSCEQAMTDGYTWLWIDTCCIDKRSSVELSEAIGTMYRWYRSSQLCYVYLNDVDELAFPTEPDFDRFGRSNGWPEWFSRGWTLQELIAPTEVEFFNKDWVSIGTKRDLTYTISRITGISSSVLRWGLPRSGPKPNIAQILSWAADCKTTRVEDRAYSLLGLFDVNMPILYGEGSKAFRRLQFEIIRASSDHTIFAWNPKGCLVSGGSVLADDPSYFRGCHDMKELGREEFVDELGAYLLQNLIDVDADPRNIRSLLYSVDPPPFRFNITNLGIQVSLPVLSDGDDCCFKAVLPCLDSYGNLVTIDLCYNRLCFSRRRPSTSIMNTI